MSIDPQPPPELMEDSLPPQPTASRVPKLAIAASSVVVLVIILGIVATPFVAQTPPALSGVMTGHGLANGAVVDETRVFGVDENVYIAYTLRGGKIGYTVAARITEAGKTVDGGSVKRPLSDNEQGLQSLMFMPKEVGVYQATLLLNNALVPGTDVTFKVVAGGSPVQEVTTAKSIDQRTYRPLDQHDVFAARDTVNITYRAVNTHVGDRLAVVYYVDDHRQPEDARDHDSFTEAGTFRGFFSISGTDTALAVGSYRAELFYNGDLVAVRMFQVKG